MNWRWKLAQAAEIRWWQRYLKAKPTADYLQWKSAYWRRLCAELGLKWSDTEGGHVLDAGCGPAGIFMIFPEKKVVAIDPLLSDYAEKIPHFDPQRYPNVRFITTTLEAYTTTQPFDVVFCLNAINHVAHLDRAFDALVAAVKPGGQLVVSIDAHNHTFLKKIFQWLPGDILHPHQYDLAEYTAMLTQRGCRLERTYLKDKAFIFNYYILTLTKI